MATERAAGGVVPGPACRITAGALYRQEDLVPGNVVSLQIGFEYAGPSDYERLCCPRWEIWRMRDCGAQCGSRWRFGRSAKA